jgi:hypothetical protein
MSTKFNNGAVPRTEKFNETTTEEIKDMCAPSTGKEELKRVIGKIIEDYVANCMSTITE